MTTETGALFSLATRLTVTHAEVHVTDEILSHIDRMTNLLGRYFQIRDDYQNLVSQDVSSLRILG